MTKSKRPARISTIEKLEMRQLITRRFVPNLTPSECLVLDYIFDRTIMWDRDYKRITIDEFEKGNRTQGGLPLGRRTITSALSSLKEKGVINAVGDKRTGITYNIRFDWSGVFVPAPRPDSELEAATADI